MLVCPGVSPTLVPPCSLYSIDRIKTLHISTDFTLHTGLLTDRRMLRRCQRWASFAEAKRDSCVHGTIFHQNFIHIEQFATRKKLNSAILTWGQGVLENHINYKLKCTVFSLLSLCTIQVFNELVWHIFSLVNIFSIDLFRSNINGYVLANYIFDPIFHLSPFGFPGASFELPPLRLLGKMAFEFESYLQLINVPTRKSKLRPFSSLS